MTGRPFIVGAPRHYGVEPRLYAGHGHWILQGPGWRAIASDILGWLSSSPR